MKICYCTLHMSCILLAINSLTKYFSIILIMARIIRANTINPIISGIAIIQGSTAAFRAMRQSVVEVRKIM